MLFATRPGISYFEYKINAWKLTLTENSPVPVVVVRPESKVRKTLDKRRADPKRGIHFDE